MSEDLLKTAKGLIEGEGEKVFLAYEVDKYHRKNPEKHDKRILVVGEYRAIYFHITPILEKRRDFHLIDLKDMKLDEENNLVIFQFRDRSVETQQAANQKPDQTKLPEPSLYPMKFKHENAREIIQTIANHLIRIMPNSTIDHINARPYSNIEKRDIPAAALCRLHAFERVLNCKLSPELLSLIHI